MRIFLVLATLALTAAGLAGCASATTKQTAHKLGLISGPLPAPKPFVVESRTTQPGTYPAVGVTPPPRSDKILDQTQRKALESSLLATPGRQPSDAEKAAKASAAKKPVPVKKPKTGFFPSS